MMRSLFSGVSGLKNHQTRMDVIGNNISNVNTTGFKSSRVNFTDILSQNLQGASSPNGNMGGTNPKQIGLGSAVGAVDLLFTNGSVQSTGVNTDLALSSPNALFILNTVNGTAYTRNGDFQFDAEGNYVQAGNGYFVQGWMANNGTIDTGSQVTNIKIPSGKTMPPASSKNATYTNNLNAEVPTITKMVGGVPSKGDSYTESGEGPFVASEGGPLWLTLSDELGEVQVTEGSYSVGDPYPGAKTVKPHTTSGDTVVVSASNVPVTATLKDGRTVDGSDSSWKFGYTTSTEGDKDTATDTKTIVVTSPDGTKSAAGVSGETYTVGDIYMSDRITDPDTVTATGDINNNLVTLILEDGSEHDVSTTNASYKIGSDKYTYGGNDYLITGYKTGFKIGNMTVTSPGGTGAAIRVDGVASHILSTTDQSATASADNKVTLTLASGATVTGEAGETYVVGGDYKTPGTSGSTGPASATNRVHLVLDDGTEVDDETSGKNYTVGDAYEYTADDGVTTIPTTIKSFSILSEIKSIQEELSIKQVDETVNPTITKITTSVTGATADNPVTVTLSDGSTLVQTSGTYVAGHSLPIVTTLAVYDTLGSVHDLPVYFTLTDAAEDTWAVTLTNDGSTTTSWQEADGSTTTVTMDPITLDFDTNGAFAEGSGTTTLTLTNGSTTPQTVRLDFTQMTQYSSSSTIAGKADGNAAGTLSSISIDKTGTITGTYTNGMKQVEAQVALQRFTNPGGLTKVGESLYEDSNNAGKSGEPSTAATLGATITPNALEMSNVDVANEFTDMIITQRGFQSNSKIITTSDEMLETLINLKR